MTLPAAGPYNGSEIRSELRQSGGNIVIPDPTTRWLTDKAAGSIQYPTDFYSKTAIKRTHNEIVIGSSTVYNSVTNLGIDFPNRRFVICVCAYAAGVASQVTTSGTATLGGQTLTLGPGQAWFNPSVNILTGIFIAAPGAVTGTSATISVGFNQTVTRFSYVVYAISNIGNTFNTNSNGGQPLTFTGTNVAVDTNGVIIASIMKSSCPAGNISMSGIIEDVDQDIGGNVRHATGFQNRLSVEASRAVNMSGTGSADICAIAVASFGT